MVSGLEPGVTENGRGEKVLSLVPRSLGTFRPGRKHTQSTPRTVSLSCNYYVTCGREGSFPPPPPGDSLVSLFRKVF